MSAAPKAFLGSDPTATTPDSPSQGLTSDVASQLLATTGPNSVQDGQTRPFKRALGKFWAPIPWMLEAAIVLQVALHDYIEAAAIAALLLFNAALGFFQEGRAQATLDALKSRLALSATVRRDNAWKTL
ncbi:MAG TPA: cation-transporting P-type ATPase, partial [Steroidobacteraceae bacterium]